MEIENTVMRLIWQQENAFYGVKDRNANLPKPPALTRWNNFIRSVTVAQYQDRLWRSSRKTESSAKPTGCRRADNPNLVID